MANSSLPKMPSATGGDKEITREDIMFALAEEGYSADQRMGWLKQVLTRLTAEKASVPSEQRQRLIAEIKNVLDDQLDADPMADDVL